MCVQMFQSMVSGDREVVRVFFSWPFLTKTDDRRAREHATSCLKALPDDFRETDQRSHF